MKSVRIDYTIREGVEPSEVTSAIEAFVAGIRAHHPEHRYTSYRHSKDPRRFTHVGDLVEQVLPDLQAQPFFTRFSAFLRERCETGPDVTWIVTVASAR